MARYSRDGDLEVNGLWLMHHGWFSFFFFSFFGFFEQGGFLFDSQIYPHICVHWVFTSYLPRCFGLFKRFFLIFGFGELVLSGFSFSLFSVRAPSIDTVQSPENALDPAKMGRDILLFVFCLVSFGRLLAASEQPHISVEREKDGNRRPQLQILPDLDSMRPNIRLLNRFPS